MKFDWKKTLAAVAPLAGTMIGGPWGGLAAKAIGTVFGHEGNTPPDEAQMSEYIQKATPEQLVQLKGIDADLRTKMRELDIKEDELVYQDKASARKLEEATKSGMPGLLAILLTVGFFGSLIALMYVEVPEANKAIVYMMIGSLGTAWIGAMQYYHGTTKSSQEKTKLMSMRG